VRLRLIPAALLVLVSGCAQAARQPPADNTAQICAQWIASTKPFISRGDDAAPEAKAYNKAIADAYAGKDLPRAKSIAIQHAYWSAQEKAPRALAAQANSPALSAALGAYANELAGRSTDVVPEFSGPSAPALEALTKICAPG
jgi:hypothetical protein